jgi:two-component system phosphate regulon sensor histidine kinase PhoR
MEAVRDHDLRRIVEKARVEGRFQSAQMEYGRELRPLRISVTPLQERGGRSTLVLCQDLTDVQRLLAMRREFVANVSHELRTPLASVKAAAEALDAGALEDGAAARDFLRRITIEVDHMAELVQRLLELARLETGRAQFEVQPLETGKLIAEAVERVRPRIEAQGLRLMMDVPQGVPWLLGDRAAIHGVLLNLLDNALKFTEQGQIKVSARAAGEMVEVAVEDTGRGIEPQDLPHVFERFYKADRSRSSPGAGLGLALAKHAVQALGGRIWAESERGKGAAFRFALPAAKG